MGALVLSNAFAVSVVIAAETARESSAAEWCVQRHSVRLEHKVSSAIALVEASGRLNLNLGGRFVDAPVIEL